jgi:O-antigen/teichoic acid export membrane protein
MLKKLDIDFIWIALAQIVSMCSGFVILKILTNQLSVENFGYYSLWLSILLFIRQVVFDPTSYIVVKECGKALRRPARLNSLIQSSTFILNKLSIALILSGFLFALFYYLFKNSFDLVFFIFFGSIYLFSNGGNGIYLAILNVLQKRKQFCLLSLLDSCLKIGCCVILMAVDNIGTNGAILSICLPAFILYFIVSNYINGFYKSNFIKKINNEKLLLLTKKIVITSMPIVLPVALTAFKGGIDRWAIAALIGVEELAAFSILMQLGFMPVIMFMGMIQTFVAPRIYDLCCFNNNDSKVYLLNYLKNLFLFITFLSFVAILIIFFFDQTLMSLVVSSKYLSYSNFLTLFVISGAITSVVGILNLVAIGVMESRDSGRTMLYSALGSVAIMLAFTIWLGFMGAVFGLLIGSVFSVFTYSFKILKTINKL